MPIIMGQIDYGNGLPRMPFFDTETGDDCSIDLYVGRTLPEIGIWLDKRYCLCGKILEHSEASKSDSLEGTVEEQVFKYLCPACASQDRVNVCSLKGVPRLIVRDDSVDCEKKCYKYPSSCSSGYCIYLAILSNDPIEVKVGVTSLQRVRQRATEGGYAAMAILLPVERNSISLPEAQFAEKRILRGVEIKWQNRILRVNETFTRNIGFVGNDLTKRQTLSAMLSPPSQDLKEMIENIARNVISEAEKHNQLFAFSMARRLASLEIIDIPDITNGDIEQKELRSIDISNIWPLKTRHLLGRPTRVIPSPNNVVAVKGPCVLLADKEKYYSLMLTRSGTQGREVFDYDLVSRTRCVESRNLTLDWFNIQSRQERHEA